MNNKSELEQLNKKNLKKERNIKLSKKELELLQEIRHGSLKKLIQMKVLPPLHPHTQKKKEKGIIKQSPEQMPESSNSGVDETLMKISRSQKLKSEISTAKFNFEGVEVQNCLTNTLDSQDSRELLRIKKSNRSMKMTFGKMQDSCQLPNQSRNKKLFISPMNPSRKNKLHLGKYEQVYKPMNRQNISHCSDKYVARYLHTPLEKAQNSRKQKISALPPLRPKNN